MTTLFHYLAAIVSIFTEIVGLIAVQIYAQDFIIGLPVNGVQNNSTPLSPHVCVLFSNLSNCNNQLVCS